MADDPQPLSAEVSDCGAGRRFVFAGEWPACPARHQVETTGRSQHHYLDLFATLAPVMGTRVPRNRQERALPAGRTCHHPLLTENLTDRILYGYGDPCVMRDDPTGCWYAVVTSNDASDSFPILRSRDLSLWEPTGFVFPAGHRPRWALEGRGKADFWAPELHRVDGRYLLCFAARAHDGTMAIGIADGSSPTGPFAPPAQPLLRGDVIDAHVFVGSDGAPLLLWKEDRNAIWPELLADALAAEPALAGALFHDDRDRRTALLVAALWRWAGAWPPMERFFALQPLIEAVVDRFASIRALLATLPGERGPAILAAMETPIYAQALAPDGSALVGERHVILVNDLDWEAHLIEGPWLTAANGRYFLFYSGNDFSTHEYGIGVAVADGPLGPYRKQPEPLLRSDARWLGPGHPSVAPGVDGTPQLFFHAYRPGEAGYNVFRAMLTARLRFTGDQVEIVD